MSESHPHKAELSDKAVFIALLVLTVVTVLAGQLGLARVPSFAVAMAIATVKASLVALYFMHLRFAVKPIYVIALAPLLLVVLVIVALLPDVGYNSTPMPTPVESGHATPGE